MYFALFGVLPLLTAFLRSSRQAPFNLCFSGPLLTAFSCPHGHFHSSLAHQRGYFPECIFLTTVSSHFGCQNIPKRVPKTVAARGGPQLFLRLGASWSHLGAILGLSWGHLGALVAILGPFWDYLESFLRHLRVVLGRFRGRLGAHFVIAGGSISAKACLSGVLLSLLLLGLLCLRSLLDGGGEVYEAVVAGGFISAKACLSGELLSLLLLGLLRLRSLLDAGG